jgi:hypothetical protein
MVPFRRYAVGLPLKGKFRHFAAVARSIRPITHLETYVYTSVIMVQFCTDPVAIESCYLKDNAKFYERSPNRLEVFTTG